MPLGIGQRTTASVFVDDSRVRQEASGATHDVMTWMANIMFAGFMPFSVYPRSSGGSGHHFPQPDLDGGHDRYPTAPTPPPWTVSEITDFKVRDRRWRVFC